MRECNLEGDLLPSIVICQMEDLISVLADDKPNQDDING